MENDESPLMRSYPGERTSSSGEADVDVDRSASTASGVAESSVATTTTIASSSLSTFYQTVATERVEHDVEDAHDGGVATAAPSHFSFLHPAAPGPSSLPFPQRQTSLQSPLLSSGAHNPVAAPMPAVPAAPSTVPPPPPAADHGHVVTAPSPTDHKGDEGQRRDTEGESHGDVPLADDEDGKEVQSVEANPPAINDGVERTVPPLAAVPELPPLQRLPSVHDPNPPQFSASLAQVDEASASPHQRSVAEQSSRGDDLHHRSESLNHEGRSSGSSNGSSGHHSTDPTSTAAYGSPRGRPASLDSTRENDNDSDDGAVGESEAGSKQTRRSHDEEEAAGGSTVEKRRAPIDREDEDYEEGSAEEEEDGDKGEVDVDGDEQGSTEITAITQLPVRDDAAKRKAPSPPTGTSRRRRHRRSQRRPLHAGPRTPATALLSARVEKTLDSGSTQNRRQGGVGGGKRAAAVPPSSSPHRRRLQLATAAPPLIAVDAPVTTHTLDVASTRSSLPSPTPSEVVVVPPSKMGGGEDPSLYSQKKGRRDSKEEGFAFLGSVPLPSRSPKQDRHGSWPTPLFSSSDSGNDEEEGGTPAPPPQPAPLAAPPAEAEETVVGETSVFPVLHRTPASTVAAITSTQEAIPASHAANADAPPAFISASTAAALPTLSSSSSTPPAALVPLSATEEEEAPLSTDLPAASRASVKAANSTDVTASAPATPHRLSAEDLVPPSPSAALRTSPTPPSLPLTVGLTMTNAVVAELSPPRFSPAGSVDASFNAATNSWTLESAGPTGPRLSVSEVPMHSLISGQSPLTMARFANRGTVSVDGSFHDDGGGDRAGRCSIHDASSSSSSYSSYYYSYSYSGSSSYGSSSSYTGSPRAPVPTPRNAHGPTSYSSTSHKAELSITRVGLADDLRGAGRGVSSTSRHRDGGAGSAGGYGGLVELTAYEDVAPDSAVKAGKASKLNFLRGLCKKPAAEQRQWRTEERVVRGTASSLPHARPSENAHAETAAHEGDTLAATTTTTATTSTAPTATQKGNGRHTAHTGSTMDMVSPTASAAVEGDGEEERDMVGSSPEGGSATEAARDHYSNDANEEEQASGKADKVLHQVESVNQEPPANVGEGVEPQEGSMDITTRDVGAAAEKNKENETASITSQLRDAQDKFADGAMVLAAPPGHPPPPPPPQPLQRAAAPPSFTTPDKEAKVLCGGSSDVVEDSSSSAERDQDEPQPQDLRQRQEAGPDAEELPPSSTTTSSSSDFGDADNLLTGAAVPSSESPYEAAPVAEGSPTMPPGMAANAAEAEQLDVKEEEENKAAVAHTVHNDDEDDGGGPDRSIVAGASPSLPPLEPLKAFYVYAEEAPRFSAWDAEPPIPHTDADDDEERREKDERWTDRLRSEATAAAAAAQAALQQALSDMAVHPPRQCLFVELHGLQQLSRTVLWPRHAKVGASGTAAAVPNVSQDHVPTAQTSGDVWHGDSWQGDAHRGAVPINGVAAANGAAAEDPAWAEVRLAVYSNDRQRLVAAGSIFQLPANAAALQRSHGLFDNNAIAEGAAGFGRDSWSDLLVYQQEKEIHCGDGGNVGQHGDDVSNATITESGRKSTTATSLSENSVKEVASAFHTAALYVQLEERKERWVPVEEETDAQPTRASPPASTRDAEEAPAPLVESDTSVSVEWKTNSDADTASSLTSPDPPTRRPTNGPQSGQSGEGATLTPAEEEEGTEVHAAVAAAVVEAAHDGDEGPRQPPLRLEEYWSFLAVSPPLPMAELRELPLDGPSYAVHMTMPASVLCGQGAAQETGVVPCCVRWAVEPPPLLPSESLPETQRRGSSVSVWASLGAAIAQYERRRGGLALWDGYGPATSDNATHKDHPRPPSPPPLTVLWDTICTPAAALQCQEADMEANKTLAPHQQHWRSGLLDAHTVSAPFPTPKPQRPSVCSVLMRCSAAVLLPQPSVLCCSAFDGGDLGLTRTYCVPTVLSVTGGLNGFVGHTTAAARATLASRTPVMRYDLDFHALLTRGEASSLLLTVRSAGTPAHVFGFAEFNPFEDAQQSQHPPGSGSAGGGGVTDLWLPMYAPAGAAVTATASQETRIKSRSSTSPVLAATDYGNAGAGEGIRTDRHSVTAGGMVLSGWLHCDVEVVFCSSLSEAAAQRLWNGASHSLTSLDAAAAASEADAFPSNSADVCGEKGWMDNVVDICVVEAAGLRPLRVRFGAPLPPAPLLREDVASFDEAVAAAQRCTHVYCEVVPLPRETVRQEHLFSERHNNAAAAVASLHGNRQIRVDDSSARGITTPPLHSAVDASSLSRASEGPWSASVSARGRHDGERAAHVVLSITAAVEHTNHPRWQHTFRCGLAALSNLCLRVFDRAGTGTHQRAEVKGGADAAPARTSAANRSLLLGTATMSPWMLRRVLASVFDGPVPGEGSAWLPLLWTPPTSASVSWRSGGVIGGSGKDSGRQQQAFFPAVSNGYVLVRWRRASSRPPPPHTVFAGNDAVRETAYYSSVTRRCPPQRTTAAAASLRKSARSLKSGGSGRHTRRLFTSRPGAVCFPSAWYHGIHARRSSPKLTWMSPEVAPWLWVHRLRLQWPWLQHTLAMRGGHVRLSVLYLASTGEQRVVDRFLLVPLWQLRRGGDRSDVDHHYSNSEASRRCTRTGRSRTGTANVDENGAFCAVSAASFSLDALQDPAAPAPSPLETAFCLPASRCVEFQLWWCPNTTPFAMPMSATSCPPRLLGRGGWRFPFTAVDAYNPSDDNSDSDSDGDSRSCTGEATDGLDQNTAASASVLQRFFTPHEADVRLSAVQGVDAPQHVESGVLRWQLSSVPRLACAAWRKAQEEEEGEEQTRTMAATQALAPLPPPIAAPDPAGYAARAGSAKDAPRWQWPDVGVAASLHARVHNLILFRCADEAAAAAAVGKMYVVVEELERSGAAASRLAVRASTKEACWLAPEAVPNAATPRVPYIWSGSDDVGIGGDRAGAWSDMRSSTQSSRSPSFRRTPSPAASIRTHEERSARAMQGSATGADGIGVASPAVELRWSPRRFEWLKDDVPTVALWLLSAETNSVEKREETEVEERVWGAVRLPRLEAFTANAGVLWLPLFRTYAAPSSLGGVGDAEPEAKEKNGEDGDAHRSSGRGSATRSNQGAAGNDATSRTPAVDGGGGEVVVEHVGFAAVSYGHNFAATKLPEQPEENQLRRGSADDAALAVRARMSRLLLVQAGPLRCRYAASSKTRLYAAQAEEQTRETADFVHSTAASNRSHPEGTRSATLLPPAAAVGEGNGVSVSYGDSDFAVAPSAPARQPPPPLQTPLNPPPSSQFPADAGFAEVLLGFGEYQMIVSVNRARTCSDSSTRRDQRTPSPPVVVFPWRSAGPDVRPVRVQTRVPALGSKSIATASSRFHVRISKEDDGYALNSGAQWVPLFMGHSTLTSRRVSVAAAAAAAATAGGDGAPEPAEGDCVAGEILVRWRLVEPPPMTMPEGEHRAPSSEEQRLHWLVETYCGGAGAPCSYAVFNSPATRASAQHPSLRSGGVMSVATGGADGSWVMRASSGSETEGNVREWAASWHTAAVPSRAPLQASELFNVLCRAGPTHHPCVYLLLSRIQLQCSGARVRAWRELMRQDNNHRSGGVEYPFRLEARMEWPAGWPTTWLCTAPPSPASPLFGHEHEPGTADSSSKEAHDRTTPHTGTIALFMDTVDGLFTSDAATQLQSTTNGAVEQTLTCTCAPLCLPLPSPQHIQMALGLPGLAARFRVSFRLFALRPPAPIVAQPEEIIADARTEEAKREEEDEGAAEVCLGAGGTPLSFPHITQHNITSLLPPPAKDEMNGRRNSGSGPTAVPQADPLFLSWRAQLSESVPLPRTSSLSARATPAGSAVLEGSESDDEALLSMSDSALLMQEANSDKTLLHPSSGAKSSGRGRRYSVLARLTVKHIEMLGVDVSLACGAAQRHRQALAPATVAVMVGGEGEGREEDAVERTPTPGNGNSSGSSTRRRKESAPLAPLARTAAPSVFLSSTVLLTPVLSADAGGADAPSAGPPPASAASVSRRDSRTWTLLQRQRQQQQQRYSWTADVCVSATTQLVLYVRVAEADLRAARGEEVWSTAELANSMEETKRPGGSALNAGRSELVAKAMFVLDAASWVQQQLQRSSSTDAQPSTHEVLLDLESLTEGRWRGRLWLEVDYLAADTFLLDPRGTFLCTNVCLQVRSCSGFVVGDVALTRRVEETYHALRQRAKDEYELRGSIPRALRHHVKEVRHMRRQLSKQGGPHARVRLSCAGEGATSSSSFSWTAPPFYLPSARSLVRSERGGESREGSWGAGGSSGKDVTSASASGPLLTLSQVIDYPTSGNRTATPTSFELRLVSLGDTDDSTSNEDGDNSEAVLAVAQVRLPLLRAEESLSRAASYTRHLSVPLILGAVSAAARTGSTTTVNTKSGELVQQRMKIINTAANAPGTLAVTATWSVTPARGDTYATCLLVEATGGRSSVGAGHRRWVLRWVYVFETSARPEVEHEVDMPLSLRPSSHEKTAPLRMSSRTPPSASPLPREGVGKHATVFWSGATTRLPRVGSMGATLRRVELLEATPVASTAFSEVPPTEDGAYTTTSLAVLKWTVEDELQLRATRRQMRQSGEDACMRLNFASRAAGGRHGPLYTVLLGLYSSNAVAQYESHRLAKAMAAVNATSATTIERATRESRLQSEGASSVASLARSHVPLLRTQADVNVADSTYSVKAVGSKVDHAAAEVEGKRSKQAVEQRGGVVMRAVFFRCGDAALSTAGLKTANDLTCRIKRVAKGGSAKFHTNKTQGKEQRGDGECVVLDAGQATRVLQTQSSPSQVEAADTKPSQASAMHITATWARADATGSFAVTRRAQAGFSPASGAIQWPILSLLRLDIPTGATVRGDVLHPCSSMADITNGGDNDASSVAEAQLCVEVCVRDGDNCVRYVSDPFSAGSVLHATESIKPDLPTSFGDCVGGLRWMTHLRMYRAETASTATAITNGHVPSYATTHGEDIAAVAEAEVLWGLDVLGIQSVLAAVPSLLPQTDICRHGESGKEGRGGKANTATSDIDNNDDDEEDDTLQQLESCAAWVDFFAALRAQEELRDQHTHLRYWRFRIVGVEVDGLALPMWSAGGVDGGERGSRLTTLLAQLNFSTRRASKGTKDEAREKAKATRSSALEDCVLGVARTTAARVVPPNSSDSMRPITDVDGTGDAATAKSLSERLCVPTGEAEPFRQFPSRTATTYRAVFTPAAWCIALHDMMRHGRVAADRANEDKKASEDGVRGPAVEASTPPGLTLWRLLSPTAAASITGPSSATVTATTQAIYELGAVQLSLLFQESALFLVRVLARWCSGACTQEERDALLGAAASFPTQWVALADPTYPEGMRDTQRSADHWGGRTSGHGSSGPRVRFFYSFSYDGPQSPTAAALHGATPPLPPSSSAAAPAIAFAVPPAVAVPAALADAVYCAQLDHVQLVCPKLASFTGGHASTGVTTNNNSEDQLAAAAVKWLSRVMLRMRVMLRTVDAADADTVIDTHVVARWTTRLAPLPSLPRLKPESEAPPASVVPPSTQAMVAPSPLLLLRSAPVPIPVPVPVPIPVTIRVPAVVDSEGTPTPSPSLPPAAATTPAVAAPARSEPAGGGKPKTSEELSGAGDAAVSAVAQSPLPAASIVPTVIPALPTTSCFCWQPSPAESGAHAKAAAGGGRFAAAVNTAVLVSIETELCFRPDDNGAANASTTAQELSAYGDRAGHDDDDEVVGRSHVYVGRTEAGALRWDGAEERLDEGWRLTAPVSVRIPVTAPFTDNDTHRTAQVPPASGDGNGSDASATAPLTPLTAHVVFDLLAFTAPSWSMVAALQAEQRASNERRLRSLTALQRTEARLLAAVASYSSSSFLLSPQPLSTAAVAHSCRLLRVPPAEYRLDSFAVMDVIEQMENGHTRTGECGMSGSGQSLWSMPLIVVESGDGKSTRALANNSGSESVLYRRTLLVDALSGEVRTPKWHLLPSLTDTARSNQFSSSRDSSDGCCNAHQQGLRSAMNLPAGRLLLQERGRLRLELCRSADACSASSLAGLIGGAAVSYTSANGDACLWVSGGLRLALVPSRGAALRAQAPQRGEARSPVPFHPPSVRTAGLPKLSSHRRRSHVSGPPALAETEAAVGGPTTTTPFYQLYASHYLCQQCTTKERSSGEARGAAGVPRWKCEVDAPSTSAPGSACRRLFHTATTLGENRVWLLGGWSAASSAVALPATEDLYARVLTTEMPVGSGLVERRRSEVRHAAATLASTTTAVLQWCETVSCVQRMTDGTPAPSVDVIAETTEAGSTDVEAASARGPSQPPPRIACHVAAACGLRHVVLFGGLMPDLEGSLCAASATAVVHAYDTVQGTWTSEPASSEGQRWPVARYGHSCAVVPGTGGTQPSSYFVFGGASITGRGSASATKNACALVPPAELLWIWTPLVGDGGQVRSEWRRVQMPTDVPSPLTGRFLPHLLALSAAEVVTSAAPSEPSETEAMGLWWGPADNRVPVAGADVGLTSLVLCVAGGMTETSVAARAVRPPSGASAANTTAEGERKAENDAWGAFRQYVERWLSCPANNVTAVLLTSMCERPAL
ncbi:hypothetical protein ABB37_05374 [Leptomonas pyrrhocoris]|uniref:Uncharacterized protein n=1 Tax=Leptomonas pyrrhocoris TaxID=157538 RepID=A0A0N0VEW9_LEPPY|nr:hypothetical protein ABB37_05374 [Leptomonas pyrrhocoris]KPA79558.1 hypothetical protein ABB37_05374 [Leptomonas pyrrhocoris]|eukprot:XP_015657997.1 hypothetical protein ABB37_05374 [Leptomonas pyrrhocoris]